MKKKILLCFISYLISCTSSNTHNTDTIKSNEKKITQLLIADSLKNNTDSAYLAFKIGKYDFGTVLSNEVSQVVINFDFENIGNTPALILKTDVSCGCLSTDYSTKPIMPGEKGVLKVMIDTKGQSGYLSKNIVVKLKANNEYVLLHVSGNIKKIS